MLCVLTLHHNHNIPTAVIGFTATFKDEKAIAAIKLRDAIITEQKRIIEGFRTEAKNAKDETETAAISLRDGIIAEQKQIIEELRDELKMVIMDWKKEGNDKGHLSRQHLRLSLKQCNRSSIFVYDHGPVSGRLFSVGDRFIDVDGKHFTAVTELRDYILWSFNKR
ncbi:unnamed protein product, partial [Anisakis simplex]|uniref:DUF3421 domain-containing protein n=1 Tax=Anisakis simplex TaxID=6269 RepID=A0A0M3J111_ANISI